MPRYWNKSGLCCAAWFLAALAASGSVAQEQTGGEDMGEVIRSRYPNRNVKAERYVIRDADENYLNHGSWKMWDPEGNLIAEGEYRNNKRHGQWRRFFDRDDAALFAKDSYRKFSAPFLSEATFNDGLLDGRWTIVDAEKRKVSDLGFKNGRRHGTATWWHSNGRKLLEMNFENGELVGELIEWNSDGEVVSRSDYQNGRRLAAKTEYYENKRKKSEVTYLFPKVVVKTPDDWWESKFAAYDLQGNEEKHGMAVYYYSNGQKKLEGEYDHGTRIGPFTQWYSNGQVAVRGTFEAGKRTGKWSWWHENGMRSIEGEYANADPVGPWLWWNDEGMVSRRADFTHGQARVVDPQEEADDELTMPKPVPLQAQEAPLPTPRRMPRR